jgi:hypothetical protein
MSLRLSSRGCVLTLIEPALLRISQGADLKSRLETTNEKVRTHGHIASCVTLTSRKSHRSRCFGGWEHPGTPIYWMHHTES